MLSMLWAFKRLTARLGYPLGYLLAFACYWLGWCVLYPTLILGGLKGVLALFQPILPLASLPWQAHLLLWWPIVFPLSFMFIPRLRKANAAILAVSLLLGLLIGITEEILWRGLFLHFFPGQWGWGMLYPAIWFGLWHICPQSVLPNKLYGGVFSFVGYAIVLGLTYALSVRFTGGAIFWCTLAHILHDTFGLGGFAYAAWLSPIPQKN